MQEHPHGHVENTAELEAFYRDLDSMSTTALWLLLADQMPETPKPKAVPFLWKYSRIRPQLFRAGELVRPEQANRRVIVLVNPGLKEQASATRNLNANVQMVLPGEIAPAHRHVASALRFIIEGGGAYTAVDGEKTLMYPGDLVMTPNWSWHDHGNETDGPMIWQDGLDMPMVNALDAPFFEAYTGMQQGYTRPVDASAREYGRGGLKPTWEKWDKPYSPMLNYSWDQTRETLHRLAKDSPGTPHDGVSLEYVNPQTGGPIMPTIGANIQLLRPGEHTQAHRHTMDVVYQAVEGSGCTIVNGIRFNWEKNDIFVIPKWCLHEHANASKTADACLFSYNDAPAMRALALYREEGLVDNDGYQEVNSVFQPL
ncbi:MAG: dehydrogenase [Chloroflexi bacterium]|nr:dehydrogenase [Chloroflexota bacterium]